QPHVEPPPKNLPSPLAGEGSGMGGQASLDTEGQLARSGEKAVPRDVPPHPPCPPLLRGGEATAEPDSCLLFPVACPLPPAPPPLSFDEFLRRTGLSQSVVMRLARADAFRSLRLDRRTALWKSLPEPPRQLTLFSDVPLDEPAVTLAPLEPLEEVVADY